MLYTINVTNPSIWLQKRGYNKRRRNIEEMHYSERIIEDFGNEESSKYLYKLTSNDNAEYYKVLDYFRKKANWLVYSLSSDDPLNTLITELKKEITNNSNTRFYSEEESYLR